MNLTIVPQGRTSISKSWILSRPHFYVDTVEYGVPDLTLEGSDHIHGLKHRRTQPTLHRDNFKNQKLHVQNLFLPLVVAHSMKWSKNLLYIYSKSTFAPHAQCATQRAPSSHTMVHKSPLPIRPTDDMASSKTKWRQGKREQPQERGFRARLKIGQCFQSNSNFQFSTRQSSERAGQRMVAPSLCGDGLGSLTVPHRGTIHPWIRARSARSLGGELSRARQAFDKSP